MTWKFWERWTKPATESEEEEQTMGLYMRREETPQQAWMSQLQQQQEEQERYQPAEGEAPDGEEPADPPDPLSTAPPEIQAAVEARLTQERQQLRAHLSRVGMDLNPDGRPTFSDMNRLQQAAGWQSQREEPRAQQAQPQQPPPRPEPIIPVPEFSDPDDGEIPDAQYNPREYRQWLDKRNQYHLAQALNQALAPVMQAVQQIGQGTTQMYVNQAVGQVEDAVQQYLPWMSGVLDHPEFESHFRRALTDIPPAQWQRPQDLASVAAMIAPHLPPIADPQFYQPQQQPAAPRASKKGRYQQQYDQLQSAEPGYLEEVPPAGPARGGATRNERGQFVGRRAAAAAVSQAAAQQAAPSRGGGRPAVTEQYDQMVLDAAGHMGISPEEARALMQDSTGDAAEQFRKKRLEALR